MGEAGSGKSSPLRFIALDTLSDRPVLKATRDRNKGVLPAWLSFALWVRMSADRGAPVPIEDVIAEFIRTQGEADLAEDMRRAVRGNRIVLLVDGLDEAIEPTAAQTLIALLTMFVDRRSVPVVATSRPHGARHLSGLGKLGSFRPCTAIGYQRRALANLWFGVLEKFEAELSATQLQSAPRARREKRKRSLRRYGKHGNSTAVANAFVSTCIDKPPQRGKTRREAALPPARRSSIS